MTDLAAHYARRVEPWIGDRSVFLVGGSFGGIVAIQLASELERRGRHVARVIALDTQAPGIVSQPARGLEERALNVLETMYGVQADDTTHSLAELVGAPSTELLRQMIRHDLQCLSHFSVPPVRAPIDLLHAKQLHANLPRPPEQHALADLGWSKLGLPLNSVVLSESDHYSLFTNPHTAEQIDDLLAPDLDHRNGSASSPPLRSDIAAPDTQRSGTRGPHPDIVGAGSASALVSRANDATCDTARSRGGDAP